MSAPSLSLTHPQPRPKSRAVIRPEWWAQAVEQLTEEHREERAQALEETGRERAAEAQLVIDRIAEAEADALGCGLVRSDARHLHPADDAAHDQPWTEDQILEFELTGELPEEMRDPSEGVLQIVQRWDRELSSSSGYARRLVRDPGEPYQSWRERVEAEAHRRVESRWHSSRAEGQRTRFARVKTCGQKSRGWISCSACGHAATELKDSCGNHYMCRTCRDRRKSKLRRRFRESRMAALAAVRKAKIGPGQARTDPIAERFLTLTIPRIPEALGGAQEAVTVIRAAWRKFWERLRNWWHRRVDDARFEQIRVVRVLEATAGDDGKGNVHLHAWMLSPFVRVEVIRWLWGQALIAAGFPADPENDDHWIFKIEVVEQLCAAAEEATRRKDHRLAGYLVDDAESFRMRGKRRLFWPRVDVRRVYTRGQGRVETPDGNDDLARELVKYLVKDVGGLGNTLLIPAETWAAIYRGLDGGRALTTSRGFWLVTSAPCPCCASVHTWIIACVSPRTAPRADDEPRGPPMLRLL